MEQRIKYEEHAKKILEELLLGIFNRKNVKDYYIESKYEDAIKFDKGLFDHFTISPVYHA